MAIRDEENPYAARYEKDAARVGTNTFQRNMADELARLQEANRIQRQTVSSSYAQQYEQARGTMMRGQMAGATPGLTGGLAQQRTSEISGAQMRGLSQLAGQREQALREVDYQGLMANRQAFDFAQQQTMAQRDEQMFNLQMINARQEILNSKMSDEDKTEALINAGLTPQQAAEQVAEKGKSWWETFKSGEGGFMGAAAVGGVAAAGARVGSDLIGASALGGGKTAAGFKSTFATTPTGKFLFGTALKKSKFKMLGALGPIGWKIGVALAIGYGVNELIKWYNKR